MKIEYQKQGAMLSDYDSFRICETLECGQCFRYEKLKEEEFRLIALNRVLHLIENKDGILFRNVTQEDMEKIWIPYFDLERDYTKIKETLSSKDQILKKAVEFAPGIRILNQDFFECLISFILSQNNRISKIKTAMKNISKKYGVYLGEEDGEEFYSFPDFEMLKGATEEELKQCLAGFRARYIIDALKIIGQGKIQEQDLKQKTTQDARQELLQIKGVGPKVADCVLLFSLGKREVFPKDVWIKKVMSYFYFDDQETPLTEIQKIAEQNYGLYAGYAQQYLFHYARTLQMKHLL